MPSDEAFQILWLGSNLKEEMCSKGDRMENTGYFTFKRSLLSFSGRNEQSTHDRVSEHTETPHKTENDHPISVCFLSTVHDNRQW